MTTKALFLDRDGVINLDHGYVSKIEDFQFVDGIFEVCRTAQLSGFKIFVVTNQSGIGRGYYTEAQFQQLTAWMLTQFKAQGVTIDNVYFCPHHPEKGLGKYLSQCVCRKPQAGMIINAMNDFSVEPEQSIMIGDNLSDMTAAFNANIKLRVLMSDDGNVDKENHATHTINTIRELIPLLALI